MNSSRIASFSTLGVAVATLNFIEPISGYCNAYRQSYVSRKMDQREISRNNHQRHLARCHLLYGRLRWYAELASYYCGPPNQAARSVVTVVSSRTPHSLAINPQLMTVLGTVLGLVISFRTSSAYERSVRSSCCAAYLTGSQVSKGRQTLVQVSR